MKQTFLMLNMELFIMIMVVSLICMVRPCGGTGGVVCSPSTFGT